MDKVAIMTWCNLGINYGQVLQAYAMQRVIRYLGYEPITIKYRKHDYDEDPNAFFLRNPLLKKYYEIYFEYIKSGKDLVETKRKFNCFVNKYIYQSVPCYNKKDVENVINKEKCNVLLCGSDQIWNPAYLDPMHFLDFGDENLLRIAYSPSIGEDKLSSKNIQIFKKMKNLIEYIDYVSVREKSGELLLKEIMSKPIKTLLDPTFLINSKGWDRIASKRLNNDKYLLCYFLGDIKPHINNLNKMMKKYKASKILYITKDKKMKVYKGKILNAISPSDFLSGIKYAEAVYTDSFHGVALSINYNEEFYTCRRYDMNNAANRLSRILNILKIFNLEDRLIQDSKQIPISDIIQYDKVNSILKYERKRAFVFLTKALMRK